MQNTHLFSEQNKGIVRGFFNYVKETLRNNVHGSFHSQILNNDSTNAMPLLYIKTPDENLRGLRNFLRSNKFEFQKIIQTTDEDRKHKGFMQVTLKNPAENLEAIASFAEIVAQNNKTTPATPISENEAQELIASFRKLIKSSGGKNGHVKNVTAVGHFDSINLYNKRTKDERPIAAIYHGTRFAQAERTLELLLNVFDFEVEIADNQSSIILITLNRGIDYAGLSRGKMHIYFPDYNVILAEQATVITEVVTDGSASLVNIEGATPVARKNTVVEEVVVENNPIFVGNNIEDESAFMKMATMSFEMLPGAEKVLFLNKYGASLVPSEEELLKKYEAKFRENYAKEFERNLRNTMADEIHDEVAANEAARLEPILRNQLRPLVIKQCKDENKNDMLRVLGTIIGSEYHIVKSGASMKFVTAGNGKLVLEGTVSPQDLMKRINEVVK